MLKMKIYFMLSVWILLTGCVSTNSNYYVLSVAPDPSVIYHKKHQVIGVEKVTVPSYLYKREIVIAKSSSQITLLGDAVWGEDLDTGLTQRVISFLQKKFNEPNVYAYPWGIQRQPDSKISIHITRFIAEGNKVYLDANWEIFKVHTQQRKAKLFHVVIPTEQNSASIVNSMDKAFSKLEDAIARGLK